MDDLEENCSGWVVAYKRDSEQYKHLDFVNKHFVGNFALDNWDSVDNNLVVVSKYLDFQ